MYHVLVPALAGPALVAAATVAARRWSHRAGGVVSALPAIVGPVLLIGALAHGAGFAARAATGTLLGLAALSAFALVYGRIAVRASWRRGLLAAWAAAAVIAAIARELEVGPAVALGIAVASVAVALGGMPDTGADAAVAGGTNAGLVLRMVVTAALILGLAFAADRVGPELGGILAALPVLACVLAVFAHRDHGGAAAVQLLRGMLIGMTGFVVFCALVAVLATRAGVAAAFVLATVATLAAQAPVAVVDR